MNNCRVSSGLCASSVVLFALLVSGCESASPPVDRSQQILDLARGEAGQIDSLRARFARQLNIADIQNQRGEFAEAAKTLAVAQAALESAKPGDLNDESVLAGWVSLSELSRAANDPAAANHDVDQAIALLHALQPEVTRSYYVCSLADEVEALHGKPAAAALLAESGVWLGQIKDKDERREGLITVADNLFDDDAFDAGRDILRVDPDAAWRTDVLVALASVSEDTGVTLSGSNLLAASAGGAGGAADFTADAAQAQNPSEPHILQKYPASTHPSAPFGKSLDYRHNFAPGSSLAN